MRIHSKLSNFLLQLLKLVLWLFLQTITAAIHTLVENQSEQDLTLGDGKLSAWHTIVVAQ
jgi:hypothetical protein